VIYHEGKTPGSVLCGLVYAHGCALLVCIRVYDAKKILVDALGVGTPDYPSGIPVMHTIHDPRKSVVNLHNRVDIKVTSSITVPK
jgi:hypothetical protein